MSYFLMETPDTSWGYFDFRINALGTINTTVFNTVTGNGDQWGTSVETNNINPYPFGAGQNFTLTFHVLDQTSLQVRY